MGAAVVGDAPPARDSDVLDADLRAALDHLHGAMLNAQAGSARELGGLRGSVSEVKGSAT